MAPGQATMDAGQIEGFDDAAVARAYQDWYSGPGFFADYAERTLLEKMLARLRGVATVLEVGCGTGHFTRWLAGLGFEVIGADRSAAMLAEGRRLCSPPCILADAQDLPFATGVFDLVAMITALEFIADPVRAVAEAVRVARKGLLLGVLNQCSVLAVSRYEIGHRFFRAARLLTPWRLEEVVRRAAAKRLRSLRWRTTLWPVPVVWDSPLPWGGFIGLCAELSDVPANAATETDPHGGLPTLALALRPAPRAIGDGRTSAEDAWSGHEHYVAKGHS